MADRGTRHSETFDDEFLETLEYLVLVSRKMAAGDYRARRQTKTTGSGIDFADHRPYTPGDDVRDVDWRVFRRTEKLFVKRYEQEEDLHIYLLVDNSRSMHIGEPDKWTTAQQIVAALAYIGLSNLDRVSVVPFSSTVDTRMAPTRGSSQIFGIFDILEQTRPAGPTEMERAFEDFVNQQSRPGLAVVVSDFFDPGGFEAGLDVLRYHRFEPMVVQLFDRRELSVPVRGDVELVDAETGRSRQMTVTAEKVHRYAGAFEEFSDRLETYCTRNRILSFRAPIQESFDELVLRMFRTGAFLD